MPPLRTVLSLHVVLVAWITLADSAHSHTPMVRTRVWVYRSTSTSKHSRRDVNLSHRRFVAVVSRNIGLIVRFGEML
jgi:hypothetical protein